MARSRWVEMSAMVYGLAKVDEKKYRENYDRIFNKGNKMHDELHMEIGDLKDQIAELEKMLHENAQTMQDMIDANVELAVKNKKYDDIIDFVKEHDMFESLQEWWNCN